MTDRRRLIVQGFGAFILTGVPMAAAAAEPVDDGKNMRMPGFFKASPFKAIEKQAGGRIGVFAMQGPRQIAYREDERFAMCSTFKWVLAACVLKSVDEGKLSLEQRVSYGAKDLLDYAPVTRARVAEGSLPLGDLCAAMVSLSDNTAANLALGLIGGPRGFTAFVRALGDKDTRLDRLEPELNTNLNKDPRDTTTPMAMTQLLVSIYRKRVLSGASVARLKGWMVGSTTGLQMIRAGAPEDWVVGDKTGRGGNEAVNDVAVLWPPTDHPVFLSIYTTGTKLDQDGHNRVVAEIARTAIALLH